MGRVRDAISSVTVCNGETHTMKAQNRIATSVPTNSALAHRRSQMNLPSASANPAPRIGPIRGESSMAPITTAGEDSSMPRIAMPADMQIMKM